MKFINALEQAHAHIRTLKKSILLLCGINALLVIGWIHSQSSIRIDIPPQIPESGLTLTQGKIPNTTVYSFAYYIWQSLNHWENDGMKDYQHQIEILSPFLTPEFKLQLINDYNTLLNQGELQDRIRFMQGITANLEDVSAVKEIRSGVWQVHLKMQLTEMMNGNAKVVKDIQMNYTLKIVRQDIDPKQNPWGLALAGFAKSPSRMQTLV